MTEAKMVIIGLGLILITVLFSMAYVVQTWDYCPTLEEMSETNEFEECYE